MIDVTMDLRDLQKAQAKMEQMAYDVAGGEMVRAIRDVVLIVQRTARSEGYVPVDTGRLRASIVPEVRGVGRTVIGVVGTNVVYAPFMEFGTRPHWPPRAALDKWAVRHHIPVFLVLQAIARRGTKARRFLARAVEDNRGRINRVLDGAGRRILEK